METSLAIFDSQYFRTHDDIKKFIGIINEDDGLDIEEKIKYMSDLGDCRVIYHIIYAAIYCDKIEYIKYFQDKKFNFSCHYGVATLTYLTVAYLFKRTEICDYLISNKLCDNDHCILLYHACRENDNRMLEFALSKIKFNSYNIVHGLRFNLEKERTVTDIIIRLSKELGEMDATTINNIQQEIAKYPVEIAEYFINLNSKILSPQALRYACTADNLPLIDFYLFHGVEVNFNIYDVIFDKWLRNGHFTPVPDILELFRKHNIDLTECKDEEDPIFDQFYDKILECNVDPKNLIQILYDTYFYINQHLFTKS